MLKTIRLHGITSDSIVDGPGLRLAVFVQGCPHHCPGCHNPGSHAMEGGFDQSIDEIVRMVKQNPLLAGITLSGGEPLEQAAACLSLLDALPDRMNVWLYTGWTWEEVHQSGDECSIRLVHACDVVVDGRYEKDLRSLELRYRGSGNQRLIDVRGTLQSGSLTRWEPMPW